MHDDRLSPRFAEELKTAPITPAAREAVERLFTDGPVARTEAAAADQAIRFLLDGLGVASIAELKTLVDRARAFSVLSG